MFGKSIENPTKKVVVKIVTIITINKENDNCRINLNKPIYLGTSILDLSKVLMQD